MRSHSNRALIFAALIIVFAVLKSPAKTWELAQKGLIPSDGTDYTSLMQKAIDECAPGDTLSLPRGTLLLSKTLHVKSGVKIIGAGTGRTVLELKARTQTDFFDLSGARNVE